MQLSIDSFMLVEAGATLYIAVGCPKQVISWLKSIGFKPLTVTVDYDKSHVANEINIYIVTNCNIC